MDLISTDNIRSQLQQANVNIVHLFWVLLPPFVAFLLFNLSNSIKDTLILTPGSFVFHQFYTSQFIHYTSQHLISSLIIYAIFLLATYTILVRIGHKKMFWKSYVAILAFAPFMGSIIWVYTSYIYPQLGDLQIYGFSTIASAAIGFFGFGIVMYLKTFNAEKTSAFLSIFTFGVAFVPAIYGHFLPSALLFLLCVLAFIFSTRNSHFENRHLYIILIWLILFQIGVQSMFPPDVFYEKFAVNIPSHYAGFSTGIIIPMFLTLKSN